MGILDDLLKKAGNQAKNAAKTAVNQTANNIASSAENTVRRTAQSIAFGKTAFKNQVNLASAANSLQGVQSVPSETASGGSAADHAESAPSDAGTGKGTQSFVFSSLPQNLAEMRAMPESDLSTPFKAAALTVLALCRWGESVDDCHEMLDFLRGPRPLSEFEKQFIRDRLRGREYLPFSYFSGSSPDNGYTPDQPYTITVFEDIYSYQNQGYCRLNIRSSGADSPRQITLRCQSGTTWRLWENYLLPMIREPKSADPWA